MLYLEPYVWCQKRKLISWFYLDNISYLCSDHWAQDSQFIAPLLVHQPFCEWLICVKHVDGFLVFPTDPCGGWSQVVELEVSTQYNQKSLHVKIFPVAGFKCSHILLKLPLSCLDSMPLCVLLLHPFTLSPNRHVWAVLIGSSRIHFVKTGSFQPRTAAHALNCLGLYFGLTPTIQDRICWLPTFSGTGRLHQTKRISGHTSLRGRTTTWTNILCNQGKQWDYAIIISWLQQ